MSHLAAEQCCDLPVHVGAASSWQRCGCCAGPNTPPATDDLCVAGAAAVRAGGVQAQAAAAAAALVLQQLDPLQQAFLDLQAGTLAGDWEGALELVGQVIDALRGVRGEAAAS